MGKIGNVAIIKRVGTTDQRSSKKLTKIVPSNDILKESFSPADFDLQASSSSSSSSLAASAASLEMTMMSANSHFLNDKNFFEEPLSFIYNTRQKFLLNILWTQCLFALIKSPFDAKLASFAFVFKIDVDLRYKVVEEDFENLEPFEVANDTCQDNLTFFFIQLKPVLWLLSEFLFFA